MPARLPITAIILTRNEELHLARALASIDFAERVVVVDSGSTDRTVDIARAHGAEVLSRAWLNYADQFNWALDAAEIVTPWTMRLDADEVIEPDLAANIAACLPALAPDVSGICFKRKHIFMGRWVRHGGRYPLTLLRLWRTGLGHVEERWMDEHVVVARGRAITLEGGFADINLNDTVFFTDKHNRYATREAIDALLGKYGLGGHAAPEPEDSATPLQARVRRRIKNRLYNRLPFGLGPLLYFLWRFIFQLGFMDGREGRIYHVLQGFWYRFLVDVRRLEFERAMAGASDNDARLDRLSAASGYSRDALAGGFVRSTRSATASQGLPE